MSAERDPDLLLQAQACLLPSADTPLLLSVHSRAACPCSGEGCEATLRASFPCPTLSPSLTQPGHTVDPCDLLVRLPEEGLRVRRGVWRVIGLCWGKLQELHRARAECSDLSAHASSLRLALLAALTAGGEAGAGVQGLMVRHNEAWMVARTAAAMAPVLQQWVSAGQLAGPQPWLLDCISAGTAVAADAYVEACTRGKEQMMGVWEKAPASLSNWGEDAHERLYACIEGQLACLHSLASAWWSVLPTYHVRRALGFLLDLALHALLERIWELRNIDDMQGRDLSQCVHRLMDGAALLASPSLPPGIPEQGAYAAFNRGQPCEGAEDTDIAARYIRLWPRAGQIARILLADGSTMAAWCTPGGEIDTVGGVSRREMARLVKALLHDSEERDALLDAVLKGADHIPPPFQ